MRTSALLWRDERCVDYDRLGYEHDKPRFDRGNGVACGHQAGDIGAGCDPDRRGGIEEGVYR